MSTADVSYRRAPAARVAQAQAGKARRQKLLLGVGALLFVALLAVQVPRTLRMLSPTEPAVVAPADVALAVPAPAGAVPAPAETSGRTGAQIERIQAQYTAKDPFARRPVSAPASAAVGVRPAPAGARDPFAPRVGSAPQQSTAVVQLAGVRDPFTQRAAAVPAPPVATPPPPVQEPVPVTGVRLRGFTVILVSVPVRAGRPAAQQVAAAARARGVRGVGVLRSSDYATLRPGYFAVYSRVFETRAEAQRAVGQARAAGYPRSYVRPLGR